ncbi:hypothetical protein PT287_03120 [Lactobacillus sp. ESL0679]|uniref:hypothetical protein n=1 Tax=Lactobacillus sp. ESL0679 TaxID=2983209 RepID=UPI0023F6487E|nr:hypothetical protein [Lactobacillus sp. ESL0679]MDF7682512.1 hypothetical protein [Lactobacillus sp. ESL0679]
MSKYNKTVLTNAGIDLAKKVNAGRAKFSITKAATSSENLSDKSIADLQNLTELPSIMQYGMITDVEDSALDKDTVIGMDLKFNNKELAHGYSVNAIGLYAKEDGGSEFLYAIATAVDPEHMPDFNNKAMFQFNVTMYVVVGQSSNVTINVTEEGVATKQDLVAVEAEVGKKANVSDVYDKAAINQKLGLKANSTDVTKQINQAKGEAEKYAYDQAKINDDNFKGLKQRVDTDETTKANKADVYNKQEVDDKVAAAGKVKSVNHNEPDKNGNIDIDTGVTSFNGNKGNVLGISDIKVNGYDVKANGANNGSVNFNYFLNGRNFATTVNGIDATQDGNITIPVGDTIDTAQVDGHTVKHLLENFVRLWGGDAQREPVINGKSQHFFDQVEWIGRVLTNSGFFANGNDAYTFPIRKNDGSYSNEQLATALKLISECAYAAKGYTDVSVNAIPRYSENLLINSSTYLQAIGGNGLINETKVSAIKGDKFSIGVWIDNTKDAGDNCVALWLYDAQNKAIAVAKGNVIVAGKSGYSSVTTTISYDQTTYVTAHISGTGTQYREVKLAKWENGLPPNMTYNHNPADEELDANLALDKAKKYADSAATSAQNNANSYTNGTLIAPKQDISNLKGRVTALETREYTHDAGTDVDALTYSQAHPSVIVFGD